MILKYLKMLEWILGPLKILRILHYIRNMSMKYFKSIFYLECLHKAWMYMSHVNQPIIGNNQFQYNEFVPKDRNACFKLY